MLFVTTIRYDTRVWKTECGQLNREFTYTDFSYESLRIAK